MLFQGAGARFLIFHTQSSSLPRCTRIVSHKTKTLKCWSRTTLQPLSQPSGKAQQPRDKAAQDSWQTHNHCNCCPLIAWTHEASLLRRPTFVLIQTPHESQTTTTPIQQS